MVLFSGVCESLVCTWLGFESHVKHLFVAKYPFSRKLSLQEIVPEYHASRVMFSCHLSFCFQTWNGIRVKVGHVPNDFLSAVVLRWSVFSCRGEKTTCPVRLKGFLSFSESEVLGVWMEGRKNVTIHHYTWLLSVENTFTPCWVIHPQSRKS